MIPLINLLSHVLLGSATAALITKSYGVPLVGLFVYWTLGFVSVHIDASALDLLAYWTAGPTMGLIGVTLGTLVSHLLGVPRLLDALLLPNDGNKQSRAPIRRIAWEVHLLHLFVFLIFLSVKFITGAFSDDSTSTLGAVPSLAIGITLVIIAGTGVVAVLVVACIGEKHKFEKRQNLKYFFLLVVMVLVPVVLAVTVLPLQCSAWWASPLYLAVVLGLYLVALVHAGFFTFFSGAFSLVDGTALDESVARKGFFDQLLTHKGVAEGEETSPLVLTEDGEVGYDGEGRTVIYDNLVNRENLARLLVPLLVLNVVVIFVDWVTLYWLCVTNVVTHAIVLGVTAAIFAAGIVIAYLLMRRRNRTVSANRAYPAFTASPIGRTLFNAAHYANSKLRK